ncbi:MAG: hypothetical protein RLZZ262_2460 [Bacteroidota bacterium]|jgi:carboxyl-terminal processing protease
MLNPNKTTPKLKRLKAIFIIALTTLAIGTQGQKPNTSATSEKFATLLYYIENAYVDTVNAEKLTEKAIVALLEELDPHSVYLSKEELQEANEPLNGSFDGIGVQFNIFHDTILVVEPIQGGPSEKLGIRPGDKIVTIDGDNVAGIGIKNNDVFKKLRGPKGTKVNVGIQRTGSKDLIPYSITRDKIPIYSLDAAYIASPGIGYIKISRFAKTTMEELKAAIIELKNEGMKDLVLDLQGNGGGYLNIAVEMCDEFLSGDKLLVYTEGTHFRREDHKANPTQQGSFEKGRLIVLIDESSASASEILSGAIQDWDRGMIVGRRSFGKGLVQRPVSLPDGSAVRLTVQKYYTPSGRCIQKPYNDGLDAYLSDKEKRFKNGEYFSMDKLELPDSLKFYTNNKKRVVYGGGGIMPDVFVPLDTTDNSPYFSELLRTGINNDWVLSYVNSNREMLLAQYPNIDSFMKGYTVPESGIKEMIKMLEDKKVPYNHEEFKRSENSIIIRTKALIARNLYDNESFFIIINALNPAMLRAIEILKDGSFEKANLAHKEFK